MISDPQAPSPFQPAPIAPSTGRGCSKPVFVGCGVLLLLLGIGAVVFVVNAPSLFHWWLGIVEEKIMAVVPDDVTPAERADLHQAFNDLGGVFRHGRQPDARYLQRFQTELMQIISKPKGQVTRQQILELTRVLEQTAGKRVPDSAPGDAAPAPGPASPGAPSPVPRT